MRLSFSLFSVLCCAVVFSATAQAACGGGGFKSGTSKPTAMSQAVSSDSSQSYSVSYSSHTIPTLDMRQFDATAKKLQITDSQQAEINRLREDVARRSEGLRADVDRAQAKLDACDGKCDKERRKLEDARAKMRDFENREFSPRALGILTEPQRKMLYERNDAK